MVTFNMNSDGKLFSKLAGPAGEIQPVYEWADDANGKRRPTSIQARDHQGKPLWQAQVQITTVSYGRVNAEIAALQFAGDKEEFEELL